MEQVGLQIGKTGVTEVCPVCKRLMRGSASGHQTRQRGNVRFQMQLSMFWVKETHTGQGPQSHSQCDTERPLSSHSLTLQLWALPVLLVLGGGGKVHMCVCVHV